MTRPFGIAILAFDDVEALDLAGPYEVFTTAARMAARPEAAGWAGASTAAGWQVACVARTLAPVRARAGLQVVPTRDFNDPTPVDLLIVPGGVVDAAARCPDTLDWVRRASAQASLTASVCTGAFVLAAAGVVNAHRVTTHWEDLDDLRRQWPSLEVVDGVRWVEDGRVFSSAGISAGIDLSLHLVARLTCPELAERTARQMDYRWMSRPD
ncbi:DJ-1/PfpI family protein [Hydrogenophaga pseudoflava]|uniref:DJ-1/PfpI family protein n=1 Tax=Hydrogenophaga pseudoflava TaxID=47421 RepID=UPI0027E473E8|nr:DJ-1/PfpI family protein [Hydrogenophaga pseudoflava]MDQ7746864.1 DJ-1/PfpI family protein [Hydrogenophaga pseudoflava]